MNLFRTRLVENSTALFLVKIIDLGLTIWLIPYLISVVGLDNYGLYAFSISIVIILINILNYGFDLVSVREIAQSNRSKKTIRKEFVNVFNVKILLGVGLILFYVLSIFLIPYLYKFKELYLFSVVMVFSHFFSLRWFFIAVEKMKYLFFIRLVKTLFFISLLYIFIKHSSDYIYIALIEGVVMLLVFSIVFIVIINEYKIKLKLQSFKKSYSYLVKNFNSFINLLIPSLYNNALVFVTGFIGLPVQISIVQIGVKLLNAFSVANSILTKAFYPLINRVNNSKLSSYYLIPVGVLVSLVMYFFSPSILHLWFKDRNTSFVDDVVNLIKVLSIVPFLISIISSYGINGLLILKKDKLFTQITVFSFLVLIILIVVLLPVYGAIGVGFSLLISRLFYALLSFIYFKKNVVKKNL